MNLTVCPYIQPFHPINISEVIIDLDKFRTLRESTIRDPLSVCKPKLHCGIDTSHLGHTVCQLSKGRLLYHVELSNSVYLKQRILSMVFTLFDLKIFYYVA